MSLQPVSRFCCSYRTAIATFLLGLLIGSLVRELDRPAYAQIPNPGIQRLEANQQMEQLNVKMSELLSILRTGTLKVRVVETDKTPAGTTRAMSPNPGGYISVSPAPGTAQAPAGSEAK